MAVDVGFVDGTTAATTPKGSAISTTRRSSMAGDDADGLHRPDEFVNLLRAEEILLNLVFDDAVTGFLDGEPGERFSVQVVAAAAIASTTASMRSWLNSASSSHACLARRASARASATEARSRSVWVDGAVCEHIAGSNMTGHERTPRQQDRRFSLCPVSPRVLCG